MPPKESKIAAALEHLRHTQRHLGVCTEGINATTAAARTFAGQGHSLQTFPDSPIKNRCLAIANNAAGIAEDYRQLEHGWPRLIDQTGALHALLQGLLERYRPIVANGAIFGALIDSFHNALLKSVGTLASADSVLTEYIRKSYTGPSYTESEHFSVPEAAVSRAAGLTKSALVAARALSIKTDEAVSKSGLFVGVLGGLVADDNPLVLAVGRAAETNASAREIKNQPLETAAKTLGRIAADAGTLHSASMSAWEQNNSLMKPALSGARAIGAGDAFTNRFFTMCAMVSVAENSLAAAP